MEYSCFDIVETEIAICVLCLSLVCSLAWNKTHGLPLRETTLVLGLRNSDLFTLPLSGVPPDFGITRGLVHWERKEEVALEAG